VLLVAIVTTLPEGAVTVAAALRKSYGIAIGNVYGSCAFNVFILFFSDLFYFKGPLLGAMQAEHFVAAAGAFTLMGMGYLILRGSTHQALAWAQKLTLLIPLLYFGALYLVFTLGQA
jgi:cation:H+ antiporter